MNDLMLSNARLADGRRMNISIHKGVITAIEPAAPQLSAQTVIDAGGCLAVPAFVNGQLHACKSFWRRHLATLPAEVQHLDNFAASHHVKAAYTEADVYERVDETMRLALSHGTCGIRLFADVDRDNGLTALRALLRIREHYSRWMTVQVVAFPQDGLKGDVGQIMHDAMSLGADVVGGIPFIEQGEAAQIAHINACFDLARSFDRALHFVVDDVMSASSRTLEMIAETTITLAWQQRVACTQCAALSAYDDAYAAHVISLVQRAGIAIYSNSHVSLIATEFDTRQHPHPRNITRVRQLLEAGVPVIAAQDDVDNWFYPFGRNDMLEVAQFMAHQGRFAWRGETGLVLPMVTTTPASVLGMQNYGLAPGSSADIVVLECRDWHEAIQFQPAKRFVILRGELLVENLRETRWHAKIAGDSPAASRGS
jgi:cytosine deaminase